jgi:hypothetical protein
MEKFISAVEKAIMVYSCVIKEVTFSLYPNGEKENTK